MDSSLLSAPFTCLLSTSRRHSRKRRKRGQLTERSKRVKVFTASWCAPCQTYKKQLDGLDVEIIDVEEQMDLAIQYQAYSVPMTVFQRNGMVTHKVNGPIPRSEVEAL